MDAERFDSLARTLAARPTRRQLLRGLLGGAVAAVVLGRGRSAAAACRGAGRSCTGDANCCSGLCDLASRKCACPPGTAVCRNDCRAPSDYLADANNCGSCGNRCAPTALCQAAICSNGACVNVADPNQVGYECAPGKVCYIDGSCGCPGGLTACNGACVDTAIDPLNCGTCNGACECNQTCVAGGCKGSFGAPATSGDQCASGFAADGVCCDGGCGGQCEACDASGHCQPVSGAPVGGRPACGGIGVCGGTCDGQRGDACSFPPTTTFCQDTACVEGDAYTYPCNGGGSCLSSITDCGLFACEGGSCLTSCADDGDCRGDAYCDGGNCVGDRPNGQPCDRRDQCQSGFCVDGVCCHSGCTGECQACNVPGSVGICTSQPTGTSCGTDRSCCLGTCCAPGATCNGITCSATCLGLGERCTTLGACCPGDDDRTTCGFTSAWDTEGVGNCCRELGASCSSDDDCCWANETQFGQVTCQDGVCGGAGSACFHVNACARGECCGIAEEGGGVCCGETEACSNETVTCQPRTGESCTDDSGCAFGICCGGVCVERTVEHCASCDDVCPSDYICHIDNFINQCRRPRREIGSVCDYDEECLFSDVCMAGVCCNECGGQCGMSLPDNTTCGGQFFRGMCCDGECHSELDYNHCGTCGNACPPGLGTQCGLDPLTDQARCDCTEPTICLGGGIAEHHTCRIRNDSGFCVTTVEGELACIDRYNELSHTTSCTNDADCDGLPSRCSFDWSFSGSNLCSSHWVCANFGCFGQMCTLVLPQG